MAIVDGNGIALSCTVHSASPAENKLLEETLEVTPDGLLPKKLIGDKAYDDNALDERLHENFGIELIAPNRRRCRRTQDARPLRRYRRRWKVERLFAWLGNFRRLVVRYEHHVDNFMGFLSLALAVITLRYF
jgi:transposase